MNRMMQWFSFSHLPQKLQDISQPCGELAERMDAALPEGPEKTAGLRKLLEAKDCFVRALLDKGVAVLFALVLLPALVQCSTTTRMATGDGSYLSGYENP